MPIESVRFDLDAIINNINEVKELKALVEKLKQQVEEMEKASNALKTITGIYKESIKISENMVKVIPSDNESYQSVVAYSFSLKDAIQEIDNLKKEYSTAWTSETDKILVDSISKNLQDNFNNVQKNIDSYMKKVWKAEKALQKFSKNAADIFCGNIETNTNELVLNGLQKAIQKIKLLDSDFNFVKVEEVNRAEIYIKMLKEMVDSSCDLSADI